MAENANKDGYDDASWALIALAGAAFIVLQLAAPFRIEAEGLVSPLAIFVMLLLASAAARLAVQVHPLAAALPFFRQVLVFSCLGAALSYQVAAKAGPLWDPAFRAWDQALGFSSGNAFAALDGRPLLAALNTAMYHSLVPQMVVALLALAWFGKLYEMRVLLFASIAAGLGAILLSGLLPAAGNLYDPAAYPNLGSSAAWLHRGDIEALRAGTLKTLDLDQMKGIVTFPSYHAALATIYIAAFRTMPVLRWLGGGWAALTVAATPAGGGHYLVDVIAGIVLALLALKLARSAVLWKAALRWSVPAPRRASSRRSA